MAGRYPDEIPRSGDHKEVVDKVTDISVGFDCGIK